jgi:hypothetical protein
MPNTQKLIDAAVERFDEKFCYARTNIYDIDYRVIKDKNDELPAGIIQIKDFLTQELTTAYNQGRNSLAEEVMELEEMQEEKVGLPVTQKQEQSNYDKKVRNQLRQQLKTKIETLKGTTE